ncbi:ionotropic receptor 21a-like [Palaemon carinicauda]|uniref:ionotropic receptor 21a-like n=1 Tax=Palaemon carinicauda TaxID=392227 RepID=UPI0035B682A2
MCFCLVWIILLMTCKGVIAVETEIVAEIKASNFINVSRHVQHLSDWFQDEDLKIDYETNKKNSLLFYILQDWVLEKGLLNTIVNENLYLCTVTIFYEATTTGMALILSKTLNERGTKLYRLSPDVLKQMTTWIRSSCDTYIFLVATGEILIQHASVNHLKAVPYQPGYRPPLFWNYDAYYIIALTDPSSPQPSDFIGLYNFKKTQNLLILQQNDEFTIIWTHALISKIPELEFLDTWVNGSFLNRKQLFKKKFDNFQKRPVRVATFEFAPSVVYAKDDDGHVVSRLGVDMEVIQGLAVIKNFTVEFIEVSYEEKWGTKYPNGSWDGLMREVYDEISDIGVCNVFIDDVRWTETDYSYPYNFMPGCFVTPTPKPLSNWQSPTLPFAWSTWVSIGISLLVGGPLLFFLSVLSMVPGPNEFRSISYNYLYFVASLTTRTLNTVPSSMPARIYVGFVWIYCLILATGYSANLIAFLSVTQKAPPIDTLDQLIKSGLRLGGHSFWKTQFEISTDPTVLKLASLLETNVDYLEVFKAVEAGTFSFVENKQYLELNRDARFTYGDRPTIRIARECYLSYNIALILPRHSPLTDNLTNGLLRIFESGMMMKWQAEVTKHFRKQYADERSKTNTVTISRNKTLNLGHVQGVFYIMVIGYVLSILLFLYEKLLKK